MKRSEAICLTWASSWGVMTWDSLFSMPPQASPGTPSIFAKHTDTCSDFPSSSA